MGEKIEIIRQPFFKDNPSNPAKVYMDKGLIVLNEEAFYMLPEFARKFVIEHEKGHYYLQSYNEAEADSYALHKLAYTEPNSLLNSVKAVTMIAREDPKRIARITYAVLAMEAENGNEEARKALGRMANAEGENKQKQTMIYVIAGILVLTTIYFIVKWLKITTK